MMIVAARCCGVLLLTGIAVFGQNPATSASKANYAPLNFEDRMKWAAVSTFGLKGTGAGLWSTTWSTFVTNSPEEWHGRWEGWGKRFASREASVAISNTGEALFSQVWGEDPRYITDHKGTIKQRVGRAILQGVAAHNRRGELMPAYARYLGTFGGNWARNSWMPPSGKGPDQIVISSIYGFGGRMVGNGFTEFWPEIKKLLRIGK